MRIGNLLINLFFLLFGCNTFASDLIDVVKASQFLNKGIKEVGEAQTHCSSSSIPSPNENSLIKLSDAPDTLLVHAIKSEKEYIKIFNEPPKKKPDNKNPFYISLILENDKRFIYEQLTKQKSDDVGRTHGMEIHAGTTDENGVNKDLSLSTYAYTEKIRNLKDENGNPIAFHKSGEQLKFLKYQNGTPVYTDTNGNIVPSDQIAKKPQHFQEVDTINFLVDNVKSAQPLYYKAGAGIIMVVSDKPTALGAVTQQHKWHELEGKTVYDNISDGEKDRFGVTYLGALGVQKRLEDNNLNLGVTTISYEIRSSIEAGIRGDTIYGGEAWTKASAGVGLGPKLRKDERRFEINASIEHGKSQLKKLELALNGEDCSVLVSYEYYQNDEKKYAPLEEGTMHFGSKCHF